VEALKALLAEGSNTHVDPAEVDNFRLSPVPGIAAKAPLDDVVLKDLRVCINEYEKQCAEEFAKNKHLGIRDQHGRWPQSANQRYRDLAT